MSVITIVLWSAVTVSSFAGGQPIDKSNAGTFVISSCSPKSGGALGFFLLETTLPSHWPRDKFCQALAGGAADKGIYKITLQLFNELGPYRDSINGGHPGIAFNVKDSMNYDFVYFRPHSSKSCYQTGYIKDSNLILTRSSTCPRGPPKGRKWFNVLLEVTDHKTKVFLDGNHVVTFSHHHANVARGGAIVCNGYLNHVLFRGYKTDPLVTRRLHSKVAGCVSHSETPTYNTLDATWGSFPSSGFCRIMIGPGVAGINYRVSVDLYNVQGWKGVNSGHLGVMYNAEDMNNFDFVYFRPHWVTGCFQTGYVRGGKVNFDEGVTGRCPNGVPAGQRWFHVGLHVNGNSAAIYKDGVLAHTAKTRFKARESGGVIVANGYKNIARYKHFIIRAQSYANSYTG